MGATGTFRFAHQLGAQSSQTFGQSISFGKERQGGFLFVPFALIFKSTAKNQLGPLRTKAAETERDEIE